ncbi:MAG: lcrH [Chlamydiia bacterium]|nr:lcrH [Chlamydiia bacterium]
MTTAIEQLVERLRKMPSISEIHAFLDAALNEHGSMTKMLNLNGELLDTLALEASRLYQQSQFEEATSFFQLLSIACPGLQEYWMLLGACRLQCRDYDSALSAYAMAIILNEDDPRPYFFSALCYKKKGDTHEFQKCIQRGNKLSNKELI